MSQLVRAAWAFFLVVVFPSLGAAQKLVVGNTAISAEGLPIWFAHETGIYKKNGLDVQPVFLGGGGTAVAFGDSLRRVPDLPWLGSAFD
jgi:ABC-type nitrate/sulfonate/bicarbonate transport system substrate-binding protein